MRGCEVFDDFFFMALTAIFLTLVLNFKSLPLVNVSFAVKAICEVFPIDAEVSRYDILSGDEKKSNDPQDDVKGPVDMVFHKILLLVS
jgi:hypothetical protein